MVVPFRSKAASQPAFAWIEVDGVKAPFYLPDLDIKNKLATTYVESGIGAEIVLCYRLGMGKPHHDIRGVGKVDGVK